MPDRRSDRSLVQHFFRRFFQNDLVQTEGDTITTVVRAVAILAAPGLLIAFFLQNSYPARSPWGRVEDHYFFVLFSFVALAGVSIFEWDMLFPDRLDFLVLSSLPLSPIRLFRAKALALAGFLALFLIGSNLFSTLLFPMVSKSGFWRPLLAHALAVLLAGTFSSLAVAGIGGLLLTLLPEQLFRRVSPLVQLLAVTLLGLLLAHCVRTADSMEQLLSPSPGLLRFVPTFWFLGLYEQLLHGSNAAAFAAPMARLAWLGIAVAGGLALVTYPSAWLRMQRMAVEPDTPRRRSPDRTRPSRLSRLIPSPSGRAVTHFIALTLRRNSRYQVYLALYSGTGLALSLACAIAPASTAGHLRPTLSLNGLYAVMPLLLFWTVAGLRMAFALPLNLPAAWIFRTSGTDLRRGTRAARHCVLACTLALLAALLVVFRLLGLSATPLLVQLTCGLALSTLLIQGFFFSQNRIPFTSPRIPGRSSLPLLLTLYIGGLTPFLFGMAWLEHALDRHPLRLLWLLPVTLLIPHLAESLRNRAVSFEEEREGDTGELQLLGLAGDLTA